MNDALDPLAQMARLDALIAAETDESRIRAGLGIRLALALAQEMKAGKPIGSETAALVTAWVHDYGQETVDAAVKVAREFLTKPEELRKTLGQRLGLDGQAWKAGPDMSARYASVDIGTNTAKLLVAEARDGVLQPVFQRAEATRVGRNVSVTGRISEEAFAALESALRSFAQDVRDQGAVLAGAIATQAFRMASNGPELLEKVAAILGCEARTIAGPDEARLGWLAVANRYPSAELAVLDIGGGSTEATRKGQGVSTPIGAVALLETCGPDASACRVRAQEAFAEFPDWGSLSWAAVGGTATALAMLELGLSQYDAEAIEGLEVSLARITERIDSLARMSPDELLAIPGLGKGRADIVMPGLCILEAFLKQVRGDKAIISDRGIRYGLLVDWLRRRRAAAP